ncbi:hypothetical protein [Coleofasciculus sp. FACHB-SPT9]|uniref:hypothetical protein n=1 Tax=Cyanophyceae TaxID=3028117 RepID=UPI0018EF74D8|nr:hypothetical protein [Coleofasciculus sp. FACHB-SPT9]
MLVRLYWSQCEYRNFQWGATPVDSFWVEATYEEAEKAIFPFVTPEAIEKSKNYAKRGQEIAAQISNPPKPYCFLVAKDLSSIAPFDVHYPFSSMWNGYSPFEEFSECHIETLEQLKNLALCKKLEKKINYTRLEYIKNVNNVNEPDKWAYEDYPLGSHFQLNFKEGMGVEAHALKLPKGALIILSQKPVGYERCLTHIVELVNEGSEDQSQWKLGEWGIFRRVKIHWVADFSNPYRIPLDKDVMRADWGWRDTKAKSLASPSLMSQWNNIESLRTHLKGVFS